MRSAFLAAASAMSLVVLPAAVFAQGAAPENGRGGAGAGARGGAPAPSGASGRPDAGAHPPALLGGAGQRAGVGNLPIENGRNMGANRAVGGRDVPSRRGDGLTGAAGAGTGAAGNGAGPGRMGADRASGRGGSKLDAAQRSSLRATLRAGSVNPIDHPNFAVHTGTIVPTFYQFYSLPSILVDLYPQYSGYDYILIGDEILVIEPSTRRIVDIIPA